MPPTRPVVIGYHLIFTGYGHWLPNDPRGSGSACVNSGELRRLGPIQFGRKRVQPSRDELREFLRKAEEVLSFPLIWFDEAKRQAAADGFRAAIKRNRYTCYACSILRNHAHALIRRHRDDAETMAQQLADAATEGLQRLCPELAGRPIWGRDNYKVFKDSVQKMWGTVAYIRDNPEKEGLPPQAWDFVTPYDGWPLARGGRRKT